MTAKLQHYYLTEGADIPWYDFMYAEILHAEADPSGGTNLHVWVAVEDDEDED